MVLGKFTEGMDVTPRNSWFSGHGENAWLVTRWWFCPIAATKQRHQLSNVSLSVAAGAERTSGSDGSDGAAGPHGK